MLVFRCECEQVLGVDDVKGSGRLGECPSCGRIIRVPRELSDMSAKLRLSGTPSRAAVSGPLREIAEIPAPAFQNGSATNGNGAEPTAPTNLQSDEIHVAPTVTARPQTPDSGEPVTLSPLSTEDVQENEIAAAPTPDPDVSTTVSSKSKSTVRRSPVARSGRAIKPGTARNAPVTSDDAVGSDDPAAAVETLNAKGMGTLASAAAARRKRNEAASSDSAAPQKSRTMLLVVVVVIVLVGVVLALYYTGIIGGGSAEVAPTPKTVAPKTAPAATAETKPDTTPASDAEKKDAPPTDAEKKPAEGEKKPADVPADKPGETKPADTKPTETKPTETKAAETK